ncbi:MAG: hemolysin family protein [Candidatus Omnitrophica bacterium]|nr:hemolysin family protein [Candidatus Omnitrophota bacterium]MDD5553030.1 hemolysin family protein [Candidatus Omnitrophota bacterium]
MNLSLVLISLFALAAVSFLFSSSESAIIGLNKIRLRHMVAKGVRRSKALQRLVAKMDKFIAAILIGNNFVNIAMSVIITAICVHLFGYNLGAVIATFSSAFFILIFCDITPKILATKHPERVALFTAPFMDYFTRLMHPISRVFIKISNVILEIFGVGPSKKKLPLVTEEELRLMIEIGKEEGVLTEEEKKMLHRIFEFGDTTVKKVMIPKENIIAVSINSSAEELLDIFVEEGHSRLPVYRDSIENVVGVIYARDLLYILRDKSLFVLQDIVSEPYFVPENFRVNELLRKFQADKVQIAVVVDEHKKTSGIVTIEDLTEEIVGEIEERRSKPAL